MGDNPDADTLSSVTKSARLKSHKSPKHPSASAPPNMSARWPMAIAAPPARGGTTSPLRVRAVHEASPEVFKFRAKQFPEMPAEPRSPPNTKASEFAAS